MKLEPLFVRISAQEKKFIKQFALLNNMSQAEMIRRALEYWIEGNHKGFDKRS